MGAMDKMRIRIVDLRIPRKEDVMALIDTGSLRDYMEDYAGSAMFSGFPGAIVDLAEIERMDDYQLCRKAEQMGVDLRRFVISDDDDD